MTHFCNEPIDVKYLTDIKDKTYIYYNITMVLSYS